MPQIELKIQHCDKPLILSASIGSWMGFKNDLVGEAKIKCQSCDYTEEVTDKYNTVWGR